MKIFCVRIGEKYGPEYEEYLEGKLSEYEIIWIREAFDPRVQLQWNKMIAMNSSLDEAVCVMDIDLLLINDYKKIFDFPIKRGQFAAMPGWWRGDDGYRINGGFFKYYPVDVQYIFDKFMEDPDYHQQFYIQNGETSGPVNGEQYFVENSVKEKLELVTLPDSWFMRWASESVQAEIYNVGWELTMNQKYRERTGNEYAYLGGAFHEDIKMVHFTNALNKPHEWSGYDDHI